jgi:hypothetical protein
MFATNGTSFFVLAKYDGRRGAIVTDVGYWHFASVIAARYFGSYWANTESH